jgi:TM2 domain-containing membrane protein YozV
MKNKNSAALLAFFLGGVGVHKFYLGETGWGILYAIFFWTYIPSIAGFVEALLFLNMSQLDFDEKYNRHTLAASNSRYLTNHNPPIPQVIVNIGNDKSVAAHLNTGLTDSTEQPGFNITLEEKIDRRILKLCQSRGEITLLDCFIGLEDVPRNILEERIESLVRAEFLQVGNRVTDGKVVYRLDN